MGSAGTGLRPPVNNALDMGSLVLNVIGFMYSHNYKGGGSS